MTLQGDYIFGEARPMARVILQTAKVSGIPAAEIIGPRRTKQRVRARFMAMAVCRDYTEASLPEIGRAFNRDHTSVLNALRQVDAKFSDKDIEDMETIARMAGLVQEPTP